MTVVISYRWSKNYGQAQKKAAHLDGLLILWLEPSTLIRTVAELPFAVTVKATEPRDTCKYLSIAERANDLRDLGMTYREIGNALNVANQTALMAVKHYREVVAPDRYPNLYSKPQFMKVNKVTRYIKIAVEARKLKDGGMTSREIQKKLKIGWGTLEKARKYAQLSAEATAMPKKLDES